MVPHPLEPMLGHLMDPLVIGLVGRPMRVGEGALVCVSIEGLRIAPLPLAYFVFVDKEATVIDPVTELLEDLAIRVGRDASAEAIVPSVQTADQVFAADLTVR
jgi:hypothetical protein